MTFDFWRQAMCQRQTHEGCCIKLPSKVAFVDRSSDWPSHRMPQDWRDLLRKPTSNKIYYFLMDHTFAVFIWCLLGTFVESVVGYFLSRGSVMGFHINGLPSGPFVSMDYIWVPPMITWIAILGLLLPPLPINERLKGFIIRILGGAFLLIALASVVLRFFIILEYFSSLRYLVADALRWT